MRCVAVGGLGDGPKSPFGKMGFDAIEHPIERGTHARSSVHVRPQEPGPHRALVVGGVPLRRPAVVRSPEWGVAGRQRAWPERRKQCALAGGDDLAGDSSRGVVREGAIREGDCEQLVGSEGTVVTTRSVDDVEEAEAVAAHEAVDERRSGAAAQARPVPGRRGPGKESLGDGQCSDSTGR